MMPVGALPVGREASRIGRVLFEIAWPSMCRNFQDNVGLWLSDEGSYA